jgi:predicted DNA-binding transcriptional regulator YafY
MRHADRLFQLVQLLRSRQLSTAGWLAETLGVSKRTVYRDIRDLERSGVPVRGEAGVGYRLETGFDLPPITFNTAELEALVLGARMVEAFGDAELTQDAHAAMAKVRAVLPPPLRRVVERAALFAPSTPWSGDLADGMSTVRRAMARGQKLHVGYTKADGEESDRVLRPMALFFWGPSWTVGAYCELRGAYRNFRLDRMDITTLTDTFDGSDGITLDDYITTMERELGVTLPIRKPGWG